MAAGSDKQATTTEHSKGKRGEKVTERISRRECRGCGNAIEAATTGRPRQYCSDVCRKHAWAIRRAADQLGTDRPGPHVVRDVVERERIVERLVPAPPAAPARPREWTALLAELTSQLGDPTSPATREHYDHARLSAALITAWHALDRAHPGRLHRH